MITQLNRYTLSKTGLVYWRLYRGKSLLIGGLRGFKTDDLAVKNAALVLRTLQTIPILRPPSKKSTIRK